MLTTRPLLSAPTAAGCSPGATTARPGSGARPPAPRGAIPCATPPWSTGRLLLPPLGHLARLAALQFSPDARHMLTASTDGTVGLWDLPCASPAGPRLPHLEGVHRAVFSP